MCYVTTHLNNCCMIPSSAGQGQVKKTTSLPGTSLLLVEGWLLQGWVVSCSLNDYLFGLGTEEAPPPPLMPSCQSTGADKIMRKQSLYYYLISCIYACLQRVSIHQTSNRCDLLAGLNIDGNTV